MKKIEINMTETYDIPRNLKISMTEEQHKKYESGDENILLDSLLASAKSVDHFTHLYNKNIRKGIDNGFTLISKSRLNSDIKFRGDCRHFEIDYHMETLL